MDLTPCTSPFSGTNCVIRTLVSRAVVGHVRVGHVRALTALHRTAER
ncbi:hypothetical protein [Streptomyces sp. GS7]|nr:hypothetical protein [Streptomyces sp. GS7]QHC22540.1 hypothetical protein GR130_14980 [Streptomyces sp. GS7]